MGVLERLEAASFRAGRRASADQSDFRGWFVQDPSGYWLPGGGYVSTESAQTLSAIWQGVRLRSEGVASVNCLTYRRRQDGGKDRVKSGRYQPLAYRLRWEPNRFQDSFQYWEQAEACVLLRGIFLAELIPGADGYADQLIPRHPDRVRPRRLPSGRVVFELTHELNGTPRTLTQDQVFVLYGRTEPDGVTPMSFLRYGAQSISTALAAQRMASTFFKRGTPAIAVIDKNELGEEGIKNLGASVSVFVGSGDPTFGILPLEGDLKIEKLGLSPQDAQLLPMISGGVEEVARWLNVPLHMMRMNQAGTNSYASLEVFSTEFVTYGIRPDCVRFERAIQRQLILPEDKEEYFCEFLLESLLRGNLEQRAQFYQSAVLTGYMNRNEVRAFENMNPVAGLDRFLEPENMAQINSRGDRVQRSHARVLQSAAEQHRDGFRAAMLANGVALSLIQRERSAVEHLAKKHAADPDAWKAGLQAFYEDHAKVVAQRVRVPMDTAREYAAAQGQALVDRGVIAMDGWEFTAAEQLACWALDGVDMAA